MANNNRVGYEIILNASDSIDTRYDLHFPSVFVPGDVNFAPPDEHASDDVEIFDTPFVPKPANNSRSFPNIKRTTLPSLVIRNNASVRLTSAKAVNRTNASFVYGI